MPTFPGTTTAAISASTPTSTMSTTSGTSTTASAARRGDPAGAVGLDAVSPKAMRVGLAISAPSAAFLLFDSVIKLLRIAPVVDSFARLQYPVELARGIGVLELGCLALYVLPRTAIWGALLLTGFLGGAISTHLRVGDPFFSHVLFPVYVAAPLWAGLALRDWRVRRLLGLRGDLMTARRA
jgi:hypothetical protein